jgi:hypothetical protein
MPVEGQRVIVTLVQSYKAGERKLVPYEKIELIESGQLSVRMFDRPVARLFPAKSGARGY